MVDIEKNDSMMPLSTRRNTQMTTRIVETFDHNGIILRVYRENHPIARIFNLIFKNFVLDIDETEYLTEGELSHVLAVISALNRGEWKEDWNV